MTVGFEMAEAHRHRFAGHREFDPTAEVFARVIAHWNLVIVRGLRIISRSDAAGKVNQFSIASGAHDLNTQLPIVIPEICNACS
jgi:hypothetical protein